MLAYIESSGTLVGLAQRRAAGSQTITMGV